jgi:hypothetical protein
MSIGYTKNLVTASAPAAADLSSSQLYFGKLNSSGKVAVCSSRGERAHGVIWNDPDAADKGATLAVGGIVPVECGGTFDPGDPITCDSSGKAIKATLSSDVVHGEAFESGTSGERASVLLNRSGYTAHPSPTFLEDFENSYAVNDQLAAIQADGTIASGTAQEVNILHTAGTRFAYAPMGTQTITTPVIAAGVSSAVCLNIGMDQTDNDGVELWHGLYPANGRPFIVGKDAAFYMEIDVSVADVSGTDDFAFGFRRAEAPRANVDDYLDAAAFNVISGDVYIETILNNAATSATDTTDNFADGERHAFKVLVSAAGVVTFQHDIAASGTFAAPTVTATYTFDDGDPVVPFAYFLNASDLAGVVGVYKFGADFS